MESYVVRMWLPDRPGALGQVASRIGAVRGEIVGIDILERGGGRAIDELVVDLPEAGLEDLLVQEIQQVDGVDVEEIRPVADALHDPRLDALETAAILVGASDRDELTKAVVVHSRRTVGAQWSAVVQLEDGAIVSEDGPVPPAAWLVAFVQGSQSSARVASGETGPDDVVWSPLPSVGLALVVGRDGVAYRARERRQVAALARIVDTRLREIIRYSAFRNHPSVQR
jgi:ACT domain-containing protein